MSLVTACPACTTSFKVTIEQLAACHGTVRCGTCETVFNAMEKLAEPVVTAPVAEEAAVTEQPSVYPYTIIDRTPELGTTVDAEEALFAKNTNRQDTPTKHRWLFLTLTLLLALFASLQVIYHLRTPISAKWPVTKPYLAQACGLLGCKVELPRQSELLTLDDSDLQEDADHQGLLRFSSTIINNANFAQAYPSLELTLTDTADQPILRRIFSPREYLPSDVVIDDGIAAGAEIKVRLALAAEDAAVAGYRAFIQYMPEP